MHTAPDRRFFYYLQNKIMEKEKIGKQESVRLKDENYLLKCATPEIVAKENEEIWKILASRKVDPWDLLREG
ncbi:MAG: hypothetical protein Greene07147_394 [Parcubacteria group bacterium Greene0714_7]|nr:MAG: hypothetical protein Greene07147_394 [Parcubacteria group bacterium Greene0714_7]